MKFLVLLIVAYAIYKLASPNALFGGSPNKNINDSTGQKRKDDGDFIDYEEVD